MAKRENIDKKRIAKDLYLKGELLQDEIAKMVNVQAKTISAWKTEGQWDELKGAMTVTRDKIVRNLYIRLEELSNKTPIETDKIAKVASAIEKLSPDGNSIANHINSFTLFSRYLVHIGKVSEAKLLNDYQQLFINHLLENGKF